MKKGSQSLFLEISSGFRKRQVFSVFSECSGNLSVLHPFFAQIDAFLLEHPFEDASLFQFFFL